MSGPPTNRGDMYDPYLLEVVEHLKDAMTDFSDADLDVDAADFIFLQESALHQFQKNRLNSYVTDGQAHNRGSSNEHGLDSQLALDEAYARGLELDEVFDCLDISDTPEHVGSTVDNREPAPRRRVTHARVENQHRQQDDVDPDRMTYEELQSLGDSVGKESKGVSDDLIARLPNFKYRTGQFSKGKKEQEDCVICCSEYKNKTQLIMLPCAHHYHSECISKWLKMNKNCPVCKKEVQDG